jgi:hypothetical protein
MHGLSTDFDKNLKTDCNIIYEDEKKILLDKGFW